MIGFPGGTFPAALVELAAAPVVAFPDAFAFDKLAATELAALVEFFAAAPAVAFPAALVELAAALVELAPDTLIEPITEDVASVKTRADTKTIPKAFEIILYPAIMEFRYFNAFLLRARVGLRMWSVCLEGVMSELGRASLAKSFSIIAILLMRSA